MLERERYIHAKKKKKKKNPYESKYALKQSTADDTKE